MLSWCANPLPTLLLLLLLQYLVLGWADSQSDQEVIIKLVGQLCSSARAEGGTTIVVLTQREKLEMEDLFRCGSGVWKLWVQACYACL